MEKVEAQHLKNSTKIAQKQVLGVFNTQISLH
jgi:hypothetical protein